MVQLDEIEKQMRVHNLTLSPYATKDDEAIRMHPSKEDIRPPFFHDADRILYSMAYTRYMDKTQVFSYRENDHISKRMVHVQLVSKIARTIGRALSLNEDLIEAAGLGHDLGHTPFGHVGEAILNKISLENHEGYFHHNIQSVRMLMEVENGGDGKNLTLQVLDAIMCHNGEFISQNYRPKKKTIASFLEEYQKSYQDEKVIKKLVPMTLEGCVVRISDIIAYLGRDIDDACALGVFEKSKLPKNIVDVLGCKNREIINTIIMDIISHSIHTDAISMSDEVYEAIKNLKKFNMENIYLKANSKENFEMYEKMFRSVFASCQKAIACKDEEHPIYRDFLLYKNENYQTKNSTARKIIDYMAGMTDDYLYRIYSDYNE